MIPPNKSIWVQRAFRVYNRRFLRQNFHRVHLDGDLAAFQGDGKTPLLLFTNHSSWWDLLLGVALDEMLPDWDFYGVMDEIQLKRYRFFSKLGVIGVDRTTLGGAKEFVVFCRQLFEGEQRALLIAPHGDFTSNSGRPIHFQPGIGSIAQSLNSFNAATVVFDYEFWAEKKPEAFISVRPPEHFVVDANFNRRSFVHEMEKKMEGHLNSLNVLRQQRNPLLFKPILTAKGSSIPIYDTIRYLSAKLKREKFSSTHGDIVTPPWNETKHQER